MVPPPPPKPLPPTLSHLIIFNPTFKPTTNLASALPFDGTDDNAVIEEDDVREAAQVLFYHTSESTLSRDTVLRQFGLAKGLMGFTDMVTSSEDGFYAIHSHRRRLLIWSPEKDWYIYANVKLSVQQSSEHEGKLEPTPHAQGLIDQMMVANLRRIYEDFRLLQGPLERLTVADAPEVQEMRRFWSKLAVSFDQKILNVQAEEALRQWMGGFTVPTDPMSSRGMNALSAVREQPGFTKSSRIGLMTASGPINETAAPCDPPLLRFLLRQLIAALPPATPGKNELPDSGSQRQPVGFGFSLRRKRDPSGLSVESPAAGERKSSWHLGLGNAAAWIPGIGSSRSPTPTPTSAPAQSTRGKMGAHERQHSSASSIDGRGRPAEGSGPGEGKTRWPSWGLGGIGDAVDTIGAAIGLGTSPVAGSTVPAAAEANDRTAFAETVKQPKGGDRQPDQRSATGLDHTKAEDAVDPHVDLPDLKEAVGSDTASQYEWDHRQIWASDGDSGEVFKSHLRWIIRENALLYTVSTEGDDEAASVPAHLVAAFFRELSTADISHRPSVDSLRSASLSPMQANASLSFSHGAQQPTIESRGPTLPGAGAQAFLELRAMLAGDPAINEVQARTSWSQYVGVTRTVREAGGEPDELYVLVGKQDANLVDADQALRAATRQHKAEVAR